MSGILTYYEFGMKLRNLLGATEEGEDLTLFDLLDLYEKYRKDKTTDFDTWLQNWVRGEEKERKKEEKERKKYE